MSQPHDISQRPVRKIFTDRHGGVSTAPYDSFNLGVHVGDKPSDVESNRRRLAQIAGLDMSNLVWMEQLHTNTVTVVDAASEQPIAATDALVTTTKGLALGVLVADCVPVLLSETDTGVIAAIHAGRLGARNGIVARTVATMESLGANPRRMHALIGPAASGRHYEVPVAMAADVEEHLPGSRTTTTKGTTGLDLRVGIVRQLMGLGVTNIHADSRCTIEDENFFSYRREGTTGRQAGLIWMP